MAKICGSFCSSMNENEIKVLLDSFITNLSDESAVGSYRRVAANCLSLICLHSQHPYISFYYLHEKLLKKLLPLNSMNDAHKFTILGSLICFRFMIVNIIELEKSSTASSSTSTINNDILIPNKRTPTTSTSTKRINFSLINLCEIYELCVYYQNSDDNRIVIASLECLQVILKSMPLRFDLFFQKIGAQAESFISNYETCLLVPNIDHQTVPPTTITTTINETETTPRKSSKLGHFKKDSTSSAASSDILLETSLVNESDYKLRLDTNMSSVMGSLESLNVSKESDKIRLDSDSDTQYSSSDQNINDDSISETTSHRTLRDNDNDNLSINDDEASAHNQTLYEDYQIEHQTDINNELSTTLNDENDDSLIDTTLYPVRCATKLIGNFYSESYSPLVYLIRYLSFKYLLNTTKTTTTTIDTNKLKSDSQVKIIVKAIALDCCFSIILLKPNVIFKCLYQKQKQKGKFHFILMNPVNYFH
jgi:hypothetical protein